MKCCSVLSADELDLLYLNTLDERVYLSVFFFDFAKMKTPCRHPDEISLKFSMSLWCLRSLRFSLDVCCSKGKFHEKNANCFLFYSLCRIQ